jgi:quercetin dioxygenase-like cupin family protein
MRASEERPEVTVAPRLLDVDKVHWMDGPPALPKGAKVFVVEGTPPFPANTTFTLLLKMPKNYTIPPHTHLVSERVTVLKGTFSFGHGDKVDRAGASKVKAGGLVLIPADHAHYAFTTDEETTIALSGVGPWEILYIDPKDDPRPTPATRPADFVASQWDSQVEAKVVQPNDVAFTEPPPGVMPAGVKMTMLEGSVDQPKTFVLRLQMQKGQVVPVHAHSHSERFIVLSGNVDYGFGDTFAEDKLQHLHTPTIGLVPPDQMHYARALADNTVVQIMGVGPFDMKVAPDGGMPAAPGHKRVGVPGKPMPNLPSPR